MFEGDPEITDEADPPAQSEIISFDSERIR
jgi:hypothetical protein